MWNYVKNYLIFFSSVFTTISFYVSLQVSKNAVPLPNRVLNMSQVCTLKDFKKKSSENSVLLLYRIELGSYDAFLLDVVPSDYHFFASKNQEFAE